MIRIKYTDEVHPLTPSKLSKNEYPILGKSITDNQVVLFTGPREGTVVIAGEYHPQGIHRTNWAPFNFIPYDGEIIMKNFKTKEQLIAEHST